MKICPECHTENANMNRCCRECGEPIRIDPAVEKMVRKIHAEERKKGRTKTLTIVSLALGVAGFVGYETTSRMITAAIKNATPKIQAQAEANIEAKLRADLPAITMQATKELAKNVRSEMEDGLVQAARKEVDKIKPNLHAHFAAIQEQEDADLHAAYQQARANVQPAPTTLTTFTFQPASSPSTLWQLPATSGLPGIASEGTITWKEVSTPSMPNMPGGATWANGVFSTTSINSQTSDSFISNAGHAWCFAEGGKLGSVDEDGSCIRGKTGHNS